jgi:hypothetical protein
MPRSRRSHLQLNQRDFAILRSLAEARYLSTQAIEWLHWPGWWARWQAYHHRRAAGQRRSYRAAPATYHRLHKLIQAQLVEPVDRAFMLATEQRARDPTIYTLSTRGLHVLAAYDEHPLPMVAARDHPADDPCALLRQIEVGRIYAALRACAEAQGRQITHWRAAHTLTTHEAVDLSLASEGGRGQTKRVAIEPDATCRLIHRAAAQRVFVELVRGLPPETWQRRLLAYAAYAGS